MSLLTMLTMTECGGREELAAGYTGVRGSFGVRDQACHRVMYHNKYHLILQSVGNITVFEYICEHFSPIIFIFIFAVIYYKSNNHISICPIFGI